MREVLHTGKDVFNFFFGELIMNNVVRPEELVTNCFPNASMICFDCYRIAVKCASLKTFTSQVLSESIKGFMTR